MKKYPEITLTEEKATLFIPLYAKAQDAHAKNSILRDQTAEELIKSIDFNFLDYSKIGNSLLVIRAKLFDELVQEFIQANENGIVLYLGCGLDTRINRINPPFQIQWYDLDYPEVIRLRKNYFSDKEHYKMIESSLLETGWLKEMQQDRPILIIAEGVFEYLSHVEVKTLLNCLTEYFHHGQIAFDVMSSYAVNSAKKDLKNNTGAIHKWAVDNIADVDALNPRLERITVVPLFCSLHVKKLPIGLRLPMNIMSGVSRFRNMNRILHYQF